MSTNVEKILTVQMKGFPNLETEGGEIAPGGIKWNRENADRGHVGYSPEHEGAMATFNVVKFPSISMRALRDYTGDILVSTLEGSTYVMRNVRNEASVKLAGGRVSCQYGCVRDAEEVSSA